MYVGVNRAAAAFPRGPWSIPHVCGGEPEITLVKYGRNYVFPMYVGVNRGTE